jgi:hypothetical protein
LTRSICITFVDLIQSVCGTLDAQLLTIEVKESRNASSLLLIKLGSMISGLDLFAMVSGHAYTNVTLASRDGWRRWKRCGTLEADDVSYRDYFG